MTKQEQNIFFSVIRSAIWQRDIVLPQEQFSWKTIIDALQSHGVLAFVADSIMSLPHHLLPPPDLQERIMKTVAGIVRAHYRVNKVICEVFELLEREGFKPVLLKGQGLSQQYPDRFVRAVGDIDIFIGRERFWEACDIVSRYCGGDGAEREEDLTIHWSAFKGDIDIEVHQVAADTAIPSIKDEYNRWAEQQLLSSCSYVTINGRSIRVPDRQTNSIYVFEHLLKHIRVEGIGIRQFIDWLMILRSDALDTSPFSNPDTLNTAPLSSTLDTTPLSRFHILDAWQVLGGILVWQLGFPQDAFPCWNEHKARHSQGRNLQYIIDAGNLGHDTAEAKGYYHQPPSLKRNISALRYYWHHIQFEYHLFPYDTISKTRKRILKKL